MFLRCSQFWLIYFLILYYKKHVWFLKWKKYFSLPTSPKPSNVLKFLTLEALCSYLVCAYKKPADVIRTVWHFFHYNAKKKHCKYHFFYKNNEICKETHPDVLLNSILLGA